MTENRFQDFFEENKYVTLKNYLYNYLLRKRAIKKVLAQQHHDQVLEIGSGISPVITDIDQVIYSELSFLACQTLRANQKRGYYVVADATHLPFKSGTFSHTVSSEVLEHVPDDRRVLEELVRVMPEKGHLILTVPHRKMYYTLDDRYVNHYRRYDLDELTTLLNQLGLRPLSVQKVLGPLEKITMYGTVILFQLLLKLGFAKGQGSTSSKLLYKMVPLLKWTNCAYALLVWLDAHIMPLSLSTCILIEAEKTTSPK